MSKAGNYAKGGVCTWYECVGASTDTVRGYCKLHYNRSRAGSAMDAPRPVRGVEYCQKNRCGLPHKSKGLCSAHYELERKSKLPRCSVDGCESTGVAVGMCATHRKRARKGTPLDSPVARQHRVRYECMVSSCRELELHRRACRRHYNILQRYGMSPEQLIRLMDVAECQICGDSDTPLVVDHDHSCCNGRTAVCGGCVRGMLCPPCNKGLGHFRDSEDNMTAAIRYLSRGVIES